MGDLVVPEWLKLFRGKRILVTGDTGFKGSWLSLWLHRLGAEVVGYALPPQRSEDLFVRLQLDSVINHVDGDIRDLGTLHGVFVRFQPEIVFHLAAQPLVRRSYEDPKLTWDTNVGGSVNVLESMRGCATLRVGIFVTSDKCYRNKEWVWGYRENDELGGSDPYSASKAAAELLFSTYLESFFRTRPNCGLASVRAGNVIGGGDWADDRILPDSIKALQNLRPVTLRNPQSTRPWQHVLEPLAGYLLLAARLYGEPEKFSGSWNFGPNADSIRTVKELADSVVKCWGTGTVQRGQETNPPPEAQLLHLNCDKAQQLLGWHPRWSFHKAVIETVRWYRSVHEGTPAITITTDQLRQYMEGKS